MPGLMIQLLAAHAMVTRAGRWLSRALLLECLRGVVDVVYQTIPLFSRMFFIFAISLMKICRTFDREQ